jgi:hypothetical protein
VESAKTGGADWFLYPERNLAILDRRGLSPAGLETGFPEGPVSVFGKNP